MAVAPWSYPASASTTASISLISSPYITKLDVWWNGGFFDLIDEDDRIYQAKQRRLRYAPFHITKKSIVKSVFSNRKPLIPRQTILQPFRITRA